MTSPPPGGGPHGALPGWTRETPKGRYRRQIRISASATHANAELEDDVHRFGVDIEHDGSRVLGIASRGTRYPWTICDAAGAVLERVIGAPVDRDVTALGRWTKATDNCTHRFDIAALAIAQVARGLGQRRYDMAIGPAQDGSQSAELWRDGEALLLWTLEGGIIRSQDTCDGQDSRRVLRWAQEALSPDEIESIFVLRRGLLVSTGRGYDPAAVASPADVMSMMSGVCYAFQPETAALGRAVLHNYRDFDKAEDDLLRDLEPDPRAKTGEHR